MDLVTKKRGLKKKIKEKKEKKESWSSRET